LSISCPLVSHHVVISFKMPSSCFVMSLRIDLVSNPMNRPDYLVYDFG